MSRRLPSLRGRLLLSHLVVVMVGVIVLLLAAQGLGSTFLDNHLGRMGHAMREMVSPDASSFEDGIRAAFKRALVWAAAISAFAALLVARFAAHRVLRPLQEVRRVARRLATGSYSERVPVPDEEELAALAADMNTLASELESTERRRARLISEIAHELRTPATTLQGYLEGILDGVFQPDEETLADAVRETQRMARLANDLSALSKTEEGNVELELAPVDLSGTAVRVAERLRPQFDDKSVGLGVDAGPPMWVSADQDRVGQIITNLIGNALAYTAEGGHVTVRTWPTEGLGHVEIADSGRGLTADQLGLVFERFYRADRSAGMGTGIGLTISRSLARAHGGEVSATSPGPGLGSTFTLTLPLTPQ